MKQNRTWEYVTKRLGQYHDWVNGGIPGAYYNVSDGVWYDMPIHHDHKRNANGVYDSGGEWLRYTREIKYDGDSSMSIYRPGWGLAYKGRTKVNIASGNPLTGAEILSIFEATKLKGAEAWNAMRPAKPSFNAALSIAELRELPGALKIRAKDLRDTRIRLKATSKRRLKRGDKSVVNKAGDLYLSYVFGWLPLMNDIKNFTQAFNQKKKAFDQMLRDEGRPIKRGSKLSSPAPTSTTTRYARGGSTGHNTDVSPTFVTQCYVPGYNHLCYTDVTVATEYETWCSGKFRYYLPPGPRDGPWKRALYRRIMGLKLSPDLIYNLIPWSWLADYFTDLGQFVSAVSSGVEENLYAEYAYVMRTFKRTTTYYCTDNVRITNAGNGGTKVSTMVVTDIVKVRVQATPFGFGFAEEDLSLKQSAILGALGLSRL